MKVAIIGATGFIGKNLVLQLIKKKTKIIATYNSNRKYKKNSKNITWIKLNIAIKRKNYFKYLGCPDVVINLAWPDIPKYTLKKHLKTFNLQKRLNYNLIKNGLKNLIVLGTCYEYGNISGKISEHMKCKPNIPYGEAKLKLLESIIGFKKKYNIKLTWLRPFFVYGENKKRATLYSLVKQLDKNNNIKLKVCGDLVRDFLSVNFLCHVILKIIELNKNIGILNVCSGKKVTIKKFIKKILINKNRIKNINMNGKNPNFFEPNKFWGDNSKLKKITLKK